MQGGEHFSPAWDLVRRLDAGCGGAKPDDCRNLVFVPGQSAELVP